MVHYRKIGGIDLYNLVAAHHYYVGSITKKKETKSIELPSKVVKMWLPSSMAFQTVKMWRKVSLVFILNYCWLVGSLPV